MPPGIVARPRLTALLDEGAAGRLVTVVADAGFGKSTLLASWAAGRRCAWYTVTPADRSVPQLAGNLVDALRRQVPALPADLPATVGGDRGPDADAEQSIRAHAYAGLLADILDEHLTEDLVLVLDDLQEIRPGDPAVLLVDGLVRAAPPYLHVVIATRALVPFGTERLHGRGQLTEIDGAALAFGPDETAAVLASVLTGDVPDLAARLHTAVRGWPGATRLAAEALRHVPPGERTARLDRLLESGGRLHDYLAEEIFADSPAAVRELVSTVAVLPGLGVDLCEVLELPDAAEVIGMLETRGLLVHAEQPGTYLLNPLVADFARARLPVEPGRRYDVAVRAGRWFEANGDAAVALDCFRAVDDDEDVGRVLQQRGQAMIAGGQAEVVVAAAAWLPEGSRNPAMDQVEGEARQVLGDWEGAQECFDRVIGAEGPVPAGIAWRAGLIPHLRGRLDDAIALYRRGRVDSTDPLNEALLQAWWAGAHWLRGEIADCRALSVAAMAAAQTSGDDRALAAAHTALAMLAAVDSDPNARATHYRRALGHAEQAGDVLQSIRIRTNRGSHHVSEARYDLAIEELDVAIRLADLAGFAVYRALALNNRGEALLGLGRLDEAIRELEASRALYLSLESARVAQPLANLGEVYRARGDRAMARACYEEAIGMAGETREQQSLVPSLAGLAHVLVEEEPDRAVELAQMARQAVSFGPVLGQAAALVGLGWVTLHRGDTAEASAAADEAAALCRRRRDRAGLADALELKAAAQGSVLLALPIGSDRADQPLLEALAIRREIGDPLGEARAELMLAGRAQGSEKQELADRAHARFVAAGATRLAAAALAVREQSGPPAVRIECLGGFRVLRDGDPVRLSEWPSRKARDLLKLLVARRCHPVARAQLVDVLWPDEDESVASPRLSVALSTVRAVLDPAKRFASDHFVGGDRSTVWLNGPAVSIDVEAFLADAQAGLAPGAAGSGRRGLLLRAAESSYAGDFLEEDVYADWAAGIREEARALYVRVARRLAEQAAGSDDGDAAAGYLLRILQRDPFDERAHVALVSCLAASGAHGEARRAYRTYILRMTELGVEPAPYPAERGSKAV